MHKHIKPKEFNQEKSEKLFEIQLISLFNKILVVSRRNKYLNELYRFCIGKTSHSILSDN